MRVIESVKVMQQTCTRLARDGKSIRFVPTMGALHDGHTSLVKRAIEDNASSEESTNQSAETNSARTSSAGSVIIVSIFINPIQFNDQQDFSKYPSTINEDLELCRKLGVDYVFVPKCDEIYPSRPCDKSQAQHATSCRCIVKPPAKLSQVLEGSSRSGHFEGMLTVVCKLFNIVQPERAYFGLKDYQQLVLVEKMARDFNMPIKICPVETVREAETGLPLSSRNSRLDLEQRRLAARTMYDTLVSTKKCLEDKCRRGNQLRSDCANGEELNLILLASMMTSQLWLDLDISDERTCQSRSAQVSVDYFELRCANDLSTIDYDHKLEIYDCKRGCVKSRSLPETADGDCGSGPSAILEARLLISILVSKVRLLDNIEVSLNL